MPCLLLDVDGVIIRDRLLLNHVQHNASRYVHTKLPNCKDPASVNRSLYLAYGHTARGLSTGFGIDCSDYNKKVYDKSLLSHLADNLETIEFKMDAQHISDIIQCGWSVTLFSNAPYQWVAPVARAISDQVRIRCPGEDPSKAYLKPELGFYREFDTCSDYYFVDDSLKNLGAVRSMENWYPIYFNEGARESQLWCPQISSIHDLHLGILEKPVRNVL